MTLFLLLACLVAAPAEAAIAFVQGRSVQGNDADVVLGAAAGASNHIFILVTTDNESNTISITGWATAVTTLVGPLDSVLYNRRTYAFCAAGDGADDTFTVTTSGTASAHSFTAEASGATCADEDDADVTDTAVATSHGLISDLTTTVTGALVMGVIGCESAASFTAGSGYTLIEDGTTVAAGEYQIVGAAGTYDPEFTTAASESCYLVGVAVLASGGAAPSGGSLLLLGVG